MFIRSLERVFSNQAMNPIVRVPRVVLPAPAPQKCVFPMERSRCCPITGLVAVQPSPLRSHGPAKQGSPFCSPEQNHPKSVPKSNLKFGRLLTVNDSAMPPVALRGQGRKHRRAEGLKPYPTLRKVHMS